MFIYFYKVFIVKTLRLSGYKFFGLKTMLALIFVIVHQLLAVDLDRYTWKNRIVIIAANEWTDNFTASVDSMKTLTAELNDRHLVVFQIVENGTSFIDSDSLTREDAIKILERVRPINSEILTILIGKDGGEKYRKSGVTDWQEIFRKIDAMPMRQAEMRQNKEDKK